MARRKSNKIQPAEMSLFTGTANVAAGAEGHFTIDLSQCASLLNRRFYRQGLNWAVAGFKILTGSGVTGIVRISKLPNTWVTSNAWEKAFRLWKRQQDEAVDEAGAESAVARFRDFKIHADIEHVTAGFVGNLLPLDNMAAAYAVGEWEAAQIVVPNVVADGTGSLTDPKEYTLHGVGPAVNGSISRGILQGYADSRAYPQSPDPVSPNIGGPGVWMVEMWNDGNDSSEIVDNATDRNDDLPYPQVNYPGGGVQAPTMQVHDGSTVSGTTVGGTTRFKGGNFPCGLIRVDSSLSAGDSPPLLLIDLVPGNHRGYLAEPMTEM